MNQSSPASITSEMEAIEDTLKSSGPAAALDRLIDHLDTAGDQRTLLEALLLKARHELGLAHAWVGPLAELPEPVRTQYEERYVEAIRRVGSRLLEAGDIPAAWGYFRAIGETQPITDALARHEPEDDPQQVAQLIEIAFHQGANPKRGLEWILKHYGICSAITTLEQSSLPGPAEQSACIGLLIRHVHHQVSENLVADLRQRGVQADGATPSITTLVEEHPELFENEAYHTDISHLSSVVRYSIMTSDRESQGLALELTEYGRRLSPRLQFEGAPPFERTFDDHRRFLRALLGQDVEDAIAHFRNKAEEFGSDDEQDLESTIPSQVLVNLLVRLGRLDEAIDEAGERLAGFPDAALSCPGIAELCQRAGRLDRLAQISRARGNLVQFLSAKL